MTSTLPFADEALAASLRDADYVAGKAAIEPPAGDVDEDDGEGQRAGAER